MPIQVKSHPHIKQKKDIPETGNFLNNTTLHQQHNQIARKNRQLSEFS